MQTPYRLCKNLAEVKLELDPSLPLGFDVETAIKDGKYSKICLAQFHQKGMDEVLLLQFPDPFELMVYLSQFHILAHNIHYEVTTFQRQTSTRWIPKQMDCTFLLARLFYFKQDKFSLDAVLEYLLGSCPYTDQNLDKKVMQKLNYDVPVLTDAQCRYAACDAYYMTDLYEAVKAVADEPSYVLDMSFLRSCLDFQNNGMPVQEDKLILKYESNLEDLAVKQAKVKGINCNSYVQVRKHLGGITKSAEIDLIKLWLEQGVEDAKTIIDIRKLIKQNTFLSKFESDDGRIFGTFKPSARSGRSTSDDQNLQQIPRKLKGIFGTQEGRVLVYADYAQVELRNICAITGCAKMAELFREGKDLHNYTRDFIFGTLEDLVFAAEEKVYSKNGNLTNEERAAILEECEMVFKRNRQITKTCNFNFLYGGGVTVFINILMVQAHILMGEPEGYKIRKKWRKLWKEVFGWQQKGIAEWQEGKSNNTALGRRYKAKMMTDYLNIENQGGSAEVAKLAQHYLNPRLVELRKKHNASIIICDFIHDSWIIECDKKPEQYKDVGKALAKSMQEAWFEMSKLYRINDLPMPVNVAVGTNWGDIEDDNVPNMWDYELEGMTEYANI